MRHERRRETLKAQKPIPPINAQLGDAKLKDWLAGYPTRRFGI